MSSINPTSLLRHIKMMLGVPYKQIPISDADIMDIVYEESLFTFSTFYPYMVDITIETDDRVSEDRLGVYFLDTSDQVGEELDIIGVNKMFRQDGFYTTSLYPIYREADWVDLQLSADLTSAVQVPTTFKFFAPNKIEVFPKSYSYYKFLVQLKCVHPRHLGTIPMGLRDYFYKLATLDVKIALYYMLKNYDNLNTPYGNIELKIDDYEQAVQDREQLIELFKANYWKEPNRKRLWIY